MKTFLCVSELLLLRGSFNKICLAITLLVAIIGLTIPRLQIDTRIILLISLMAVNAIALWFMMVGMNASGLLVNSQIHLLDIRQSLFWSLITPVLLVSVISYGVIKNQLDNPVYYTFGVALFLTVCMLLFLWFRSFSLKVYGVIMLTEGAIILAHKYQYLPADSAFVLAIIVPWFYLYYWLRVTSLQRQFKIENFEGIVDFVIEQFNAKKIRTLATVVRDKNAAILLGAGDGLAQRLFFGRIISLAVIAFYLLVEQQIADVFRLVVLLMVGFASNYGIAKLRIRVRCLWLLSEQNRVGCFHIIEHFIWRQYTYDIFILLPVMIICALQDAQSIGFYLFVLCCFLILQLIQAYLLLFIIDKKTNHIFSYAVLPIVLVIPATIAGLVYFQPPLHVNTILFAGFFALLVCTRKYLMKRFQYVNF